MMDAAKAITPHGVYKRKYHIRFIVKSVAFVALVAGYHVYNRFHLPGLKQQEQLQLQRRQNNVMQPMQQSQPQSRLLQEGQQYQPGFSSIFQNTSAAEAMPEHRRLSELDDTSSGGNDLLALDNTNTDYSDQLLQHQHHHRRRRRAEAELDCDDIETADPGWMCIFLAIGVLYLFLAIAIVCDEFFVEALEEISSERHMDLDKDVAGATLMAAGGSAPELFTNLFGTFDESEIGFGTIVGSAVFNVMLVIACCSIFALETLDLTWWPLFRDSTYYAIGLIVLGLFVEVSSPGEIEVWEACVLFAMYIGYVLIMWKNRDLHKRLTGKELIIPELNEETSTDDESGTIEAVKEKFDKLDLEKKGSINDEQLTKLLTSICSYVPNFNLDEAMENLRQQKDIDEYNQQEQPKDVEEQHKEIKEAPRENDEVTTWEQFSDWYRASVYFQRTTKEDDDDEAEPLYAPLLMPDDAGCWGKLWHLLCLPILTVLTLTIPDVRRPGMAKYCYVAFLLSILWIGFFAYFMVKWTEIIGNTIGVPHVVMGYTVLAAGTSVPDLLSSVIVTRQGSGDMAISSSIGSNIFDILVGLPVPWLLFMAFPSKPNRVVIESENIWIAIFVFLGMLVMVVAVIHCQGWRLTKTLGAVMCVFYFVFLAQAIVLELPFEACID